MKTKDPPNIEIEKDIIHSEENLPSERYSLILWNDDVHSGLEVMIALNEVCNLSLKLCERIMIDAHYNGKSFVTQGDIDTLLDMKNGLNQRGLEATIELGC